MQSYNSVDYSSTASILQIIKNKIERIYYQDLDREDRLRQLISRYNIYREFRAYNLDKNRINTTI